MYALPVARQVALNCIIRVQGAGWEPTYQARLNTNSEHLNITASAIIAQQTGENWTNVPVTLSTANPNQRATGRLPHVPRLSLYEENQNVEYAIPMSDNTPVVVSAREGYSDDSRAPNMAPLPNFTVSSQNKTVLLNIACRSE
ncbi:hypothetical protein PKHYL_37900 [Psychrobacter sp. KH172YL61]|uniref:DUF4139 domain-containing protein n=1 Tax=Psychrobacter sp. KH172YL61 TaxID=2517899 RepID=UPI0010BBF31B|nr:DUF4139 domain-containing protein [Psychrobacter sp. KH172YL61]BBI69599.1 hypothetical protein PKHYL_37900 [Psychrobacter sp. KH172YL61]